MLLLKVRLEFKVSSDSNLRATRGVRTKEGSTAGAEEQWVKDLSFIEGDSTAGAVEHWTRKTNFDAGWEEHKV